MYIIQMTLSDNVRVWSISEADDPALFTPFSILHFCSGVWLAALFSLTGTQPNVTFLLMTLSHLAYEIKDLYYMYGKGKEADDYDHRNSWQNSMGDQFSAMLGAALFLRVQPKKVDKMIFTYMTIFYILIAGFYYTVLTSYEIG